MELTLTLDMFPPGHSCVLTPRTDGTQTWCSVLAHKVERGFPPMLMVHPDGDRYPSLPDPIRVKLEYVQNSGDVTPAKEAQTLTQEALRSSRRLGRRTSTSFAIEDHARLVADKLANGKEPKDKGSRRGCNGDGGALA